MTAFKHYNPDRPLIFKRRTSFLLERHVAPTYVINVVNGPRDDVNLKLATYNAAITPIFGNWYFHIVTSLKFKPTASQGLSPVDSCLLVCLHVVHAAETDPPTYHAS